MTTGVPGFSAFAIEPVDQRLRDPEAFAFDQRRLAVRAFGFDDQVHVRVHPVEARDRAFDDELLRRVEHGLAVVAEAGAQRSAVAVAVRSGVAAVRRFMA